MLTQVNTQADKQVFEKYQLSIGLKDLVVLVRKDRAEAFEEAAASKSPQTLTGVMQLIEEFGGEVE
jgi:hypothetical protein